MLSWIKKHWILSIFLLVGGVPASLNYSGYCWEQKRWLSDEEFFISAIRHESNDNVHNIDGSNAKRTKIVDSDESARKFLQENPQCCVFGIGGGLEEIGIFAKMLGISYIDVDVQYELADNARTEGGKYDYGAGYLSINSCGKVIDRYGDTFEKKHSRYRNKQ